MNILRSFTETAVTTPTDTFPISFEYDEKYDAVHVFLNDVAVEDLGYTVSQVNAVTLKVEPAILEGTVRIERETDIDKMKYIFDAGALFIDQNVDADFKQIVHSQQEVRDGFIKLRSDVLPLVHGLQEALKQAQEASEAAQEAADAAEEAAQVTRSADKVIDESGATQQELNNHSVQHVETVADLPTNAKDGAVLYVKGYYKPTNLALAKPYKGGSTRVYVAQRKDEDDGFLCIRGWVLQSETSIYTPHMSGCLCDGTTDDTLNFDKLMYALEKNNIAGKVIINDDMFFNSQCPRIGKLIDPVQFNEKNAIRLVSNVDLEINATLNFGPFFAGSSTQPRCNILSAMYREDVNDWYGKNRHENIKVYGTGTLDFTQTESPNAVQDGYRWIIKASVKGMEVYGLTFKGGDFANAIQTSKTSEHIRIYGNTFSNLMSDKSLLHDHSTIYCIGKDIKVHDNVFEFTNVKGRLNACACELHGSEQWFYKNVVRGYPNLVFSAILRTDQSLDENEVVYDQKAFDNTAFISRSALGYWSLANKSAKLRDLEFYDNTVTFIEAPTLAQYTSAGVRGLQYPSDLSASVFTTWLEGDTVPNVNYLAEVLDHILMKGNTFTASTGILQNQLVSIFRFVGCYVRENVKFIGNTVRVNTILNRDVSTGTTNDYFKGWVVTGNNYDFSMFRNQRHGLWIFLEYISGCVFDFNIKSRFPTLDKTYNLVNFVLRDKSKVVDNTINIDPNGSYAVLDSWLGGDFLTYTATDMGGRNNHIQSVAFVYINETRRKDSVFAKMGVQSGSIPPSVNMCSVIEYTNVMLGTVSYPVGFNKDYSAAYKLTATAIASQPFLDDETSDRFAYVHFKC
ncbi:tail spike protein, structural depolymerase [Acinetobacter phage vB_AbaP_APK14]|uniref:Tail spike protein, structural depolymerase n=1 Tax=Acinetobacter phage vB_AbaP_APK14 TaxID=2483772 RepID=A0A4P1LUD8_9CAUD|nr:tail spike protein, structural depolymerase [Acinetobacter phage vB_AbaP_APK14]